MPKGFSVYRFIRRIYYVGTADMSGVKTAKLLTEDTFLNYITNNLSLSLELTMKNYAWV